MASRFDDLQDEDLTAPPEEASAEDIAAHTAAPRPQHGGWGAQTVPQAVDAPRAPGQPSTVQRTYGYVRVRRRGRAPAGTGEDNLPDRSPRT